MGSSAGGHLAAVTALRARDDPFFHDRPLTGQILQIPVTCHPDHYPEAWVFRLLLALLPECGNDINALFYLV